MSQSLATPQPASALRRWFLRVWDDPDGRSSFVGTAGVVLFYLLLWLFGPYILRFDHIAASNLPRTAGKQFNIELAPDTFNQKPPPKPPPPNKFVETNPDAPDNVPDKTNNFSSKNEQVAQEKPTPDGKSDKPALEGQKEIPSNQIVSGQLTKPQEHLESAPPVEFTPPSLATPPKAEQNPLPGFEKKAGESKETYGTNLANFQENALAIPEKIEGVKGAPLILDATANQPAIDPQHPRARPQIVKQQQVRPAIFEENKFGTQNIGLTGRDAKWSNYGAYLQRLIDTVQARWEQILVESRVYPPSGSTVTVTFVLDSEGKIASIVNVDNKSSEQGSSSCVSAITDRAPYGPWTDDMKAVLGDRQQMTFTFYYQ